MLRFINTIFFFIYLLSWVLIILHILSAAGNPRPLTDLVGDQNIWTVFHKKFTWILRVGSLRLQEKLVEGPPLYIPETEAGIYGSSFYTLLLTKLLILSVQKTFSLYLFVLLYFLLIFVILYWHFKIYFNKR